MLWVQLPQVRFPKLPNFAQSSNLQFIRYRVVTNEWTPLTNFPLLIHFPDNIFEIFSFQQVEQTKSKLLGVLLECFVFQFEKLGGRFGSKAQ